jgi:DNA-binding response OmpR family regulator
MGRALVVDDEIDICVLLSGQLKKLGFEASYSLTIKDANRKVSTTSFDVIFVDLNLTDGSGYDLIDSVRAITKSTKIIVISAYEGERQKVIEVGASFYIPKPFTKKSIQDALLKLNFPCN